ncbi:MAG: hypothetical protein KTQ13_03380 [Ferruginibacter sp.]|nr:hypothetical protein [Chitinophagaceae bacterium]MBP6286291.1 hypothetical protein [Ferruginibacter sp.]MBU9935669.1 hypothetical protein [Ferruginibacter sp.]
MNYLLFAVYLVALSWLLLRIPAIKKSGIDRKVILGLFLFKIVAGIAIGWLSLHFYGSGNDYWDINREAWNEYRLLLTDPAKYFSNIFTSDYPGGYGGMFSSFNSFWNDLRGNILIKLVSVFNIFSRGDYYINSLFFNFLVFFGHVALYKLFMKIYPGRQWLVITGCFLLPSAMYFSSGIHKDGLVFLLLAVLIYTIHRSLGENKAGVKRILLISITLVLLFLIRHFIFIALVPALIAWVLCSKYKWNTAITFAAVYLVTGLLLFNISSVFPRIKPLELITQRQAEYLDLGPSDTQIELTKLDPHFKSFAANAPQALNHVLLRPYLWELPVKSLLALNIELFIYQATFLLFLFFRRRDLNDINTPFLLFALSFCFSLFLLIGYIVPNLGSIVRYRSLYLPFMITPLLCSIAWDRVKFKN